MADNVTLPASTGKAATRDVTYSGEAAQAQAVGLVAFSGSDDAKTATDIPGDATNGLDVDVTRVGGNVTVVNGGTFSTQVDGAALTALQLIDDPVIADDAAFTIATSKVMMAGAAIVAHGAAPDTADAGDGGALLSNRNRVQFVIGGHPNIQSSEYFTSGAITDDNILPAISTGTIYVITSITVACSAANATSPSVRIGFGTANVPSQGATNADAVAKVILSHPGIPPGSGIIKGNGSGIVGIGGDGEELRITCTTPTTSLVVVVDWYSIAS